MKGVKRSKQPLNAKEAPCLRGDHLQHLAVGYKCAPYHPFQPWFFAYFFIKEKVRWKKVIPVLCCFR